MNLIKKSAFAEQIGVSRAGITQACKNPNLTLSADENGWIDLDAQTTIDYLENRKNKKPRRQVERKSEKLKPVRKVIVQSIDFSSDDLQKQIEQAGGSAAFKTICDIKKVQVETEIKKLKVDEQKGRLIDKSTTADYTFFIIDSLNKRLLNSPVQFVDRLIAFAKKDGNLARGKIVEVWTDEISKAIKSAISEATDCLK